MKLWAWLSARLSRFFPHDSIDEFSSQRQAMEELTRMDVEP